VVAGSSPAGIASGYDAVRRRSESLRNAGYSIAAVFAQI